MAPNPMEWRELGHLALLQCVCCGRSELMYVSSDLGMGDDVGMACAEPACQACQGCCLAPLVVAAAYGKRGKEGEGDEVVS